MGPVKTPICDFLEKYRKSAVSRLHMPGHKGRQAMKNGLWEQIPFELDITEIRGADALYEAEGIIGESEQITAEIYGVQNSCFSAGGSTLSIQAMIALAMQYGGRLLAVRNAHIALFHACILLDWQPVWLCPAYDERQGLAKVVTAEEIAVAMDADPLIKTVYLTSPDYYGREADIGAIAKEVHRRGGLLLVDNAHGAHLRFLPEDRHPMHLGADLCCDSAHKCLPVLTGGGYLHSNLPVEKERIKAAMALFGSTSPSYLILASLDLCNQYLAGPAREEFARLSRWTAAAKEVLTRRGAALLHETTDPAKIVLDCLKMGYSHEKMAARLRENRIEPEFSGGGKIVLMFSPQNPEEDFLRLENCFPAEAETSLSDSFGCCPVPQTVLSLREAAFSPWETIPVSQSVGRIAAESKVTCPPAIPIVAAGEEIGEIEKKLLQNSGIFSIKVVK